MKNNWQTKKLGDLCSLIKGKKPKSFVKKSSVPYLTAKVVRGTESPQFASDDCSNSVLIYKDDIVIIMDGSNSGEMFTGLSGALASTMGVIRYDKGVIDSRYLLHFLISHREDFTKSRTGSAIPHLNKEGFENLEISLPSLVEQQRIVKVLDDVFDNIAKAKENAEKNLANSKELFESYLRSVFLSPSDDWGYKTLKQISIDFGRGKSKHRPRNDKKLYNGEYPFIQTGDIRGSNHIITGFTQTYNEQGLSQSKLWTKGTICITIAANIAETGILGFDACFPDSVIGLVVDPRIVEIDFVEYLLQYFKVQIQSKSKGSAQQNINLATFENELFPIPLLPEQKLIVTKINLLLDKTKELEIIYKQKIAALEELKKSVLNKAFSGEL